MVSALYNSVRIDTKSNMSNLDEAETIYDDKAEKSTKTPEVDTIFADIILNSLINQDFQQILDPPNPPLPSLDGDANLVIFEGNTLNFYSEIQQETPSLVIPHDEIFSGLSSELGGNFSNGDDNSFNLERNAMDGLTGMADNDRNTINFSTPPFIDNITGDSNSPIVISNGVPNILITSEPSRIPTTFDKETELDAIFKEDHILYFSDDNDNVENENTGFKEVFNERGRSMEIEFPNPNTANTPSLSPNYRAENPQSSGRFECPGCDQVFNRGSDLSRHVKIHTGEKNFQCRGVLKSGQNWGCNAGFSRSDALERHLLTNKGRSCTKLFFEELEQEGLDQTDPLYLKPLVKMAMDNIKELLKKEKPWLKGRGRPSSGSNTPKSRSRVNSVSSSRSRSRSRSRSNSGASQDNMGTNSSNNAATIPGVSKQHRRRSSTSLNPNLLVDRLEQHLNLQC